MPERINILAVCGCGRPVEAVIAIPCTDTLFRDMPDAYVDHQRATGCRAGTVALHRLADGVRFSGPRER